MRAIYLTDIHDSLKSLRFVIKNTEADLYIISGDLIYKAFYTEDKLYEFLEIQDKLYTLIAKLDLECAPYEYAMQVLSAPTSYDKELAIGAAHYKLLFHQASVNMKEKYQVIKDLLDKYAQAKTVLIPGNYDMDLQYTALYKFDLHRRHEEVKGITFSGFGGAPIVRPGIPEMLSVIFDEVQEIGKIKSEPNRFFNDTKPDILVIHNPAYGTLDRVPSQGHIGSFGIRDYIDDNYPTLVLSGHIHEDYGLLKSNQTYCLNPSNFGGVDTPGGYEPGGYFSSFELQKGDCEKTFLRNLKLHRCVETDKKEFTIKDIVDINLDKNLRASETVIDKDEYSHIGQFLR